MDIWDKKKRSEVMSKIRSKNTKPEIALRKALFAKGYRYRINDKNLPGKPDIVLSKYKTAIFIHGCFWHEHEGCKRSHLPKSNIEYWKNKIRSNKERDNNNKNQLVALGWGVVVVWECEVKTAEKLESVVNNIVDSLKEPPAGKTKNLIKIRIYEEVDSQIMQVAEEQVLYGKQK
jgi:DNA mismatch endonuclease (patch repair protein)